MIGQLDPQTRIIGWRMATSNIHIGMKDLVWSLYGSKLNGGPDNPERIISLRKHGLVKFLRENGVDLKLRYMNCGTMSYLPDAATRAKMLDVLAREIKQNVAG